MLINLTGLFLQLAERAEKAKMCPFGRLLDLSTESAGADCNARSGLHLHGWIAGLQIGAPEFFTRPPPPPRPYITQLMSGDGNPNRLDWSTLAAPGPVSAVLLCCCRLHRLTARAAPPACMLS